MSESKVWARLRTAVKVAADGCPESWCVELLAAFKAASEERGKAQDIAAAWKALARTEREHARHIVIGDMDAAFAAHGRREVAKAALRALGVDPDAADEPGQVPT